MSFQNFAAAKQKATLSLSSALTALPFSQLA